MTNNVNNSITISRFSGNCHNSGSIQLASNETSRFLNLHLNYGTRALSACMSSDDAKKLRDELNTIYPVEAPAPAPAVPKVAPALKVGGYVKLLNGEYGGVVGVTYIVTKIAPHMGNDWVWLKSLIGTPIHGKSTDGSFPVEHFGIVEAPSKARYIVASADFDGTLSPSRNPFLHGTHDEALTEAQRLAKAHGGEFRVLKEVAAASRPAVVIPPVEVRTI